MFTIEQIQQAHSKVKSGADFPSYIQDLKNLGVKSYETYVIDGHAIYFGESFVSSKPKYSELPVSDVCLKDDFLSDLKAHQQGKTDYMTFCSDCAKSGIEKWEMDIENMTCTYFDKSGNEVLQEFIGHRSS